VIAVQGNLGVPLDSVRNHARGWIVVYGVDPLRMLRPWVGYECCGCTL
jgi:hypothetical protein